VKSSRNSSSLLD